MCVWILLKKKDKTKHAGYIHIGQDEQQHSISNLAGSRRGGLRSAPRLPSVKSITTDNTANIATVINVYIIRRHVFAVGNNNNKPPYVCVCVVGSFRPKFTSITTCMYLFAGPLILSTHQTRIKRKVANKDCIL
jgi:hypothetical protein